MPRKTIQTLTMIAFLSCATKDKLTFDTDHQEANTNLELLSAEYELIVIPTLPTRNDYKYSIKYKLQNNNITFDSLVINNIKLNFIVVKLNGPLSANPVMKSGDSVALSTSISETTYNTNNNKSNSGIVYYSSQGLPHSESIIFQKTTNHKPN